MKYPWMCRHLSFHNWQDYIQGLWMHVVLEFFPYLAFVLLYFPLREWMLSSLEVNLFHTEEKKLEQLKQVSHWEASRKIFQNFQLEWNNE